MVCIQPCRVGSHCLWQQETYCAADYGPPEELYYVGMGSQYVEHYLYQCCLQFCVEFCCFLMWGVGLKLYPLAACVPVVISLVIIALICVVSAPR